MARVRYESRTCFGIDYYATEREAIINGAAVRRSGATVNGGWFDGVPCGRRADWDKVIDGKTFYAVMVP